MSAPTLRQTVQGQAYRMVAWQLAAVVVFAAFVLLINGRMSGASVLLGGLAYGLPNLLFVWMVFRFVGASQSVQFLTAFFMGEMIKLILSGILILIIVKCLPVSLLSVLAGFIGAIVSFWIVCFCLFGRQDR